MRFESVFSVSVFIILVVMSNTSCNIRGFEDSPYPTPRVTVDTPSGALQLDVPISYRIVEVDGSKADISLHYSLDGGQNYSPATVKGGDGVTALSGGFFPGAAHTIIWDSFADGVTGTQTCKVKITGAKSGTVTEGTPGVTGDFEVQNPDYPVISWIVKPEGFVREVPLTFRWKLDTPAFSIANYFYGLDEDPPTSTTSNTFVTIPAPALGSHIFRVFAQAVSGMNSATIEAPFTVDNSALNQPPLAEITSGPSGTTNDNTPTFEYIGYDSDGSIAGYFVSIDNNPPSTWTTGTSWTSPVLPVGSHTFYLLAQDNEGANSSLVSRNFTVEIVPNQPPTVIITSGPVGTTTDDTPTYTYQGYDNDGNIAGYYISMDVDPPVTWTVQTSFASPVLPNGSHTFYVQAEDDAGCRSQVKSVNINVVNELGVMISCVSPIATGDDFLWPRTEPQRDYMVRTSDGKLHAAFIRKVDGDPGVVYSVYPLTSSILGGSYPAIAADSNDKLFVVFYKMSNPRGLYYVSSDVSGWTAVTPIIDNVSDWNGNTPYSPTIAVDSSDFLHVAFVEPRIGSGNYGRITYVRYDGASWTGPVYLSDAQSKEYSPSIAVDADRDVHVVWTGHVYLATNGYTQFKYIHAEYLGGTTWSWDSQYTNGAYVVYGMTNPGIEIDNVNNLHSTWIIVDDEDVTYLRKSAAGVWSGPTWVTHFDEVFGMGTSETYTTFFTISSDLSGGIQTFWAINEGCKTYYTYSNNAGLNWADTRIPLVQADEIHLSPHAICSLYPRVGGKRVNAPATGFAVAYFVDNELRLARSMDLTWP
jgi:hypothetical protein